MDLLRKTSDYKPIGNGPDDDVDDAREKPGRHPHHNRLRVAGLVFGCMVLFLLGSFAGYNIQRFHNGTPSYMIDKWKFQTTTKSFQYNRTFSESPSPETDAAWMSIFPPHGGFFHDKTVSENGASLAVYHQLHCLDAIRHAYWILHDAVRGGKNLTFEELPDWYTPWHFRHCVDFLRNMLQCNADVTIEKNDPKIGGIRGFGIDHQCKKWEDVVGWTLDRQKAGEDQGYIYKTDVDF